jgi:hypothetical protein
VKRIILPEDDLKAALEKLSAKFWWVNATAVAQELGAAIMANIVMLGALCQTGLTPLTSQDLETAMTQLAAAEPPGSEYHRVQGRDGVGLEIILPSKRLNANPQRSDIPWRVDPVKINDIQDVPGFTRRLT